MADDDTLLREAIRNGEDYVRTQMSLAIAADQRAVSLGGILIASASVVLGFAVTDEGAIDGSGFWLCVFLAGGLSIASGFAFYSARPVRMESIGNLPSNWFEDIQKERPLAELLMEEARFIDEAAVTNSRVIERNGKIFTWSMGVAAMTGFISALCGAVLALA